MGAIIAALIPLLGGFTQPLKDWFATKAKQAELTQQLELAKIQAEKESIVAGAQSQTSQIDYYLKAINKNFRQGFICFIVIPFCISMFAPSYAADMWHNFESMPEWYRMLLLSVCSVVLGLPVASAVVGQMFTSATQEIGARREYKLEKARINRAAVYESLRNAPQFKGKGIDQNTVNMVDEALDAGEGIDNLSR